MLNLEMLLKLITIVALTIGSIDSTDGEVSILECPQVEFSLNLTDLGLGSIPNGFVKNEFLTELILDKNKITTVTSETFSHVPKLTHLSLASNVLTSLDLQPFSKLSELKTLMLNGNCIPQPEVYRSRYFDGGDDDDYNVSTTPQPYSCDMRIDTVLHSLTHLYVESNKIQQISTASSGRLPALTHLYLSHNPLVINRDFMLALKKYMPGLTHLFLKDCYIDEFDASEVPQQVTALYLDRNSITIICNSICFGPLYLKSAPQLTILSLSKNSILRIDKGSFDNTTNLVTLDLSHNRISSITEGTFDKLENLEYLNLENNYLTHFYKERTSFNLPKLKSLLLGHNSISHISSEDFENMLKLRTLNLDDNNISIIDSGTFSNLTDLQELSLAGNQLSRISNWTMPIFSSLTTLNLNNNKFENMTHISLENVSSLISLSLKDNPLTTINVNWLENASQNLTISLGNTCP